MERPWCRFRREARARERRRLPKVVDSLKVLDQNRPFREADIDEAEASFHAARPFWQFIFNCAHEWPGWGTAVRPERWSGYKSRRKKCSRRFRAQRSSSLCCSPSLLQRPRLRLQKEVRVAEAAPHMASAKATKLDGMADMFRLGGARVKRSAGAAAAVHHPAGDNR